MLIILKKIIISTIIVAIIIISILIIINYSNNYEKGWYNGEIRHNIYVKYDDGTYESVRKNNIFNIYHDDKEITDIQYRLQGYQKLDGIIADLDNYNLVFKVYNENNDLLEIYTLTYNNTNNIIINNDWTDIITTQFDPYELISYKYGPGQYKIIASPTGSIILNNDGKLIDTSFSDDITFYLFSDGEGRINLDVITSF